MFSLFTVSSQRKTIFFTPSAAKSEKLNCAVAYSKYRTSFIHYEGNIGNLRSLLSDSDTKI